MAKQPEFAVVGVYYPNRAMFQVVVMNEKTGFEQKASDAELIALLRKVQEEIEGHEELNESNLLLHDFATELLRQRLLLK